MTRTSTATLGWLRSRLVRGFFLMLPLAAVVLLLVTIGADIADLLVPVVDALPADEVIGLQLDLLLAALVIAAACFAAGLAVDTGPGQRINDSFDRWLQRRLPGYRMVRSLARRFEPGPQDTIALAKLGDGVAVLVVVVEPVDAEHTAVFLPYAPMPTVGPIYVVANDRLQPLAASTAAGLGCVMQWGIGVQELVNPDPSR